MTDDLVSAIKDLQRKDSKAKEQWWAYCDSMGGGVRDPAKHDSDFVQSFIENYQAGNRFEPTGGASVSGGGGGGGTATLSQLCKEGQRKSQAWKEAWSMYCMYHGGGYNDPEKHDAQFLIGFLDHVASSGLVALAAMSSMSGGMGGMGAMGMGMGMGAMGAMGGMGGMGMGMGMGGSDYGPPAKRQRTSGGQSWGPPAAFAGSTGWGGGGDSQKDSLVARIKAFQRSGDEAKELWWSYCDQQLGGVRDPNRHDRATLQQFATKNSVP